MALATPGDVDVAVASARAALPAWSAATPAERSAVLAKLAELVDARMVAYPCSGEMNYRVANQAETIERVLVHYMNSSSPDSGAGLRVTPQIDRTDGVSVEFPDWRFNLRGSNTEPLLRLNVETRGNLTALRQRVADIEALIAR